MNEAFRRALRDVVPAYIVAGAILGTAVALSQVKGISIGDLTRDPSNIFGYPFYVGGISYLGAILWTATASLCLFAALLLSTREDHADKRDFSRFLCASGLLSLLLLFDDLFLFHEKFFPSYLRIPEIVTFSAYGTIAVAYLVAFRRTILKTPFVLLIVADGLLGLAMTADTLTNDAFDTSSKFLVEDGLKFFGITTWFVYYARVAIDQCSNRPALAVRPLHG